MSIAWKAWIEATLVVVVITAICVLSQTLGVYQLRESFDELYILGVVFVATRHGAIPAVWASCLSLAFWHTLMAPSYGGTHLGPFQFVISLPVFMVVAILAGQVAAGSWRRQLEAQAREKETSALYELSLAAASENDTSRLFTLLATRVREVCRVSHCSFWRETRRGDWAMEGATGPSPLDKIPADVLKAGQLVAQGPNTFLPLRAEDQTLGVMFIVASAPDFPTRQEKRVLQAVASHASLALLREDLDQRATEAHANLEAERLKASLLSSVSHDLRTPLSSIKACATSLVSGEMHPDDETRLAMMQSIVDSADRLNALVGNLLDMSRLEAGAWQPIIEAYPFVEILSSVLGRFTDTDGDRIHIQADADLPLIKVDGPQIEQVLWNLLENAVKYSPPGTPIRLKANAENGVLKVSIQDQGGGLVPGTEVDIFRKFYRARMEGGPPGLGVGLSICKAAIEAHGGRIWAENAADGPGAVFTFVLPLGTPADVSPSAGPVLSASES